MPGTVWIGIIAALAAGAALGAYLMYRYQSAMRRKELENIEELTEKILDGKKLTAKTPGEETMIAKTEHQLVRVQEMLEGRTGDAEKSRDEIRRLIAEIAHQMRTPLANMESYMELLRETVENPDGSPGVDGNPDFPADACLSALEQSERKLRFLVESFVKMSRLDQHVIQIRREESDLLKTIRNTFGQIRGRAEEKKICFDIDLPHTARCMHDSNWLGEAVFNLLDNAVKYSLPGGVIRVSLTENEMYLKLCVRDYGIGIEPGEENRIFRRFYRGKRVTDQEGFGIGLYLARKIVNLHGGFLIAKRMNQGLMIEMNLPVSRERKSA